MSGKEAGVSRPGAIPAGAPPGPPSKTPVRDPAPARPSGAARAPASPNGGRNERRKEGRKEGAEMAAGCTGVLEPNLTHILIAKLDGDTFYFRDEDGFESDAFLKHGNPKFQVFQDSNTKVLIMKQDTCSPRFEAMSEQEIKDNAPQTRFIIQFYKSTKPGCYPVTISVKSRDRIYHLSCQGNILHFKAGEAPQKINEDQSDIIFFQRGIVGFTDRYQFQPSSCPGSYLACEKKQNDPYFTMILKKVSGDENDSTHMTLKPFPQ
ncbi:interleukin-18 [Tachyglossus aculeatus]|uniref:interleukin-18 n=1 Tax=Tachyglossus aculeatus TaxID=9261 RepID=UPI0018F38D39|nr:interleukin-18 [Tachyglossus aculeatus]